MYQIKQLPADFVVNEISTVTPKDKGKFAYFLLKKTNYTTVKAIEMLAQKLRIQVKRIGFAGTKDKNAITEQVISIANGKKEIENTQLKDIQLKFLGKGDEPTSLGDLKGNAFEIVIRNIDKKEIEKIEKLQNKDIFFINYFGEQRFSKNNEEIGKHILKKEFKDAVELILSNEGDYETKVKQYLETTKEDHVGALRQIPKKILRFYAHAYQSRIWNDMAEAFAKDKQLKEIKNQKIPIIGFGTETKNDELGQMITHALDKEKMNVRDFIVRQIPELSAEGDERDLLVKTRLKIIEKAEDELNNGTFKVKLSFTLQKSSYATVCIKNIFENESLFYE